MNNQIKTHNEIFTTCQQYLDILQNIQDTLNKDYTDLRIKNIIQKRDFYYKLIISSGTILGITKFSDQIKIQNPNYFNIGVGLFLILTIFILLYIRECLDRDSVGLKQQQDDSNILLDKQKLSVRKYATTGILTEESLHKYLERFKSSEVYNEAQKMRESLSEKRTKKLKKNDFVECTAAFVLSLFIIASFFVILSLTEQQLDLKYISASIILIVCLTFLDTTKFLILSISKFFNSLKQISRNIIKNE